MSSETHELKKESKKYIGIGISLLFLTLMTVLVSKLNITLALAVFIALLIATLKGSLVASFFMHLVSEKKVIYVLLISTVFLFAIMMGLILVGHFDTYEGLTHVP